MTEREKVIKGLECCAVKNITPESARHCGICPYDRERNGEMDFGCQNDLLCAALELLKAQEPEQAEWSAQPFANNVWRCGRCYSKLNRRRKDNYCWYCGGAVKWDD